MPVVGLRIGPPVLTVINEFPVTRASSRSRSSGKSRVAGDVVSKVPGFVSGNIHISADGERVLTDVRGRSGGRGPRRHRARGKSAASRRGSGRISTNNEQDLPRAAWRSAETARRGAGAGRPCRRSSLCSCCYRDSSAASSIGRSRRAVIAG